MGSLQQFRGPEGHLFFDLHHRTSPTADHDDCLLFEDCLQTEVLGNCALFYYNSWASVKALQFCCGPLEFHHVYVKRKRTLLRRTGFTPSGAPVQ